MKNKKETWDKLYNKTEFKSILKRINYGLEKPERLYEYFPWLKLLKNNKIKIKKSLEIGAGTGSYSLVLKKLGIVDEVYLLDWSEESLETAKKLFKKYNIKGNFIQGDVRDLPFKDKEFDLVLSGGLLEHFEEKDILKILNEKKRVSKYVLTQIPISNIPYWTMRTIITILKFGWPFGFEKPVSASKNLEMQKKQGVKIIDISYHDILTAIKYNCGAKSNLNLNFKKDFLNKILRNEIAILGKSNN
jgi:SAM-dependent methyltransferase